MKQFDVPCTLDIEQTANSLHAYAFPEGVDIRPGDRVLVHGAPSHVGFGERMIIESSATVYRANIFGRFLAHVDGLLSLFELYDVGFEPRECT